MMFMFPRKLLYISVFNYGGIELAKNHLNSLISHNMSNYIAYCTDIQSYQELKALNYNVEQVSSSMDTQKLDFGTSEFNKLSYFRYMIMLKLLRDGYDVWYMDIDTVVLDNLHPIYEKCYASKTQIWFQSDMNMLCTGCMLVINSPASKELFQRICYIQNNNETKTEEHNDQVFLNHFLRTYTGGGYTLYIDVFPIFQFPNGLLFFKDDFVKTSNPIYETLRNEFHASSEKCVFVHANWMVGIDTKINALKAYGLWNV